MKQAVRGAMDGYPQETVPARVNRNAKDSVFVDLFAHPEYLIQLYRILHPEDAEAREDDLTIITLENLLLRDYYNDLGFLVGDRLMILVEAQSHWSVNVIVRFLPYIAESYSRYVRRSELNLYSSRKVELPIPELYVIYTGTSQNCPDTLSLQRDIFGVDDCAIEIKAKVIRSSEDGDILNQYITFTRIFDEQVRRFGLSRQAVRQTLRICRDRDVLYEYLKQEEVPDIMFSFFDRETTIRLWMKDELREARAEAIEEGRQEGRQEGREEGRQEGRAETASMIAGNLKNRGLPPDLIAESTGLSPEEVQAL